ncbi:MAG: alpha/beta hydrolase [Peptococcia bacterium]
MPKIKINNKEIYYEIHGEGEPLIILNGIMMSTNSWAPFKEVLSKEYKLVLFDMVDQGQSDKMTESYTQDFQVEILKGLIDQLNLGKVHLFGISYGGEVALLFANKYQDSLLSLILACTPYKTTALLHYISDRWTDVFKTYSGKAFYPEVNQHLYAEDFYEKNLKWFKQQAEYFDKLLPPAWYDGMIRLQESGLEFDSSGFLSNINVPTLVISASEDRITPPKYQRFIAENIGENASLIEVQGAAHCLPYEKPYAFCAAILGFLKVYDSKIVTVNITDLD